MGQLEHRERLDVARDALRYLTERGDDQLERPVPNCPEWTVYNAVVHVCRSALGWHEWMRFEPGDSDAYEAGATARDREPTGVPMATLAGWANSFLDGVDDDPSVATFYPLGSGSHGVWAHHAAAEWGVHRLDVEDALGQPHSMTDEQALDALRWSMEIALPGLAGRSPIDVPPLRVSVITPAGTRLGPVTTPASIAGTPVTVEGLGVQVLLAVWGRPHSDVAVSAESGLGLWNMVPAEQAQFGAWD